MSIQAITWALKTDLPTGRKFVLVALANYVDQDNRCWPSQSRLAADTGMDERTVRRHLKTLEEAGILQREHRSKSDGTRNSDIITINLASCPLVDEPTGQFVQNQPDTVSGKPSLEPSDTNTPDGVLGADAPSRDQIWMMVSQLVVQTGEREPHVRSRIGRMLKGHGPPEVLGALRAALDENAAHPLDYAQRILSDQTAAADRTNPDYWEKQLASV